MARFSIGLTKGKVVAGQLAATYTPIADPAASITTADAAVTTAEAAAAGVYALAGFSALVGAAAAQAALDAVLTAIHTALTASSALLASDAHVNVNASTVTTRSQLAALLNHAKFAAESGIGGLTP